MKPIQIAFGAILVATALPPSSFACALVGAGIYYLVFAICEAIESTKK